jgi:hypothetical protein
MMIPSSTSSQGYARSLDSGTAVRFLDLVDDGKKKWRAGPVPTNNRMNGGFGPATG